jgi:hypothetical protein
MQRPQPRLEVPKRRLLLNRALAWNRRLCQAMNRREQPPFVIPGPRPISNLRRTGPHQTCRRESRIAGPDHRETRSREGAYLELAS